MLYTRTHAYYWIWQLGALVTTLIDAFEARVVATYSSSNGVDDCELTSDHITSRCKSGPDFDAFVEQYMGKVVR
jgi:hypothetical protein